MKKLSKTLVKALMIIALFTAGTTVLSTSGLKTINEARAAVSYQTAYNYLVNNSYTVINLAETPEQGDENWISHTVKNGVHYRTTVLVEGTSILGVIDIIF